MRVIICGSRNFAYTGKSVYKLTKPVFEWGPDARLVTSVLTGLCTEHLVGFGSAHLTPFTVIEGGATGADSVAWWWASQSPLHAPPGEDTGFGCVEFEHEHYPADWEQFGKRAGYLRNQQMLDEGKPDLVIGFVHDYDASRGTKMMLELAEKAGVETRLVS